MLLYQNNLIDIKVELIKDLEKQLKSGYKAQYKSVLSNIVMGTRVFVKKKQENDAFVQMSKYNYISSSLNQRLIDLFDVFGESAIMNARVIYEENAIKWGKKLHKRLQVGVADISGFIKDIYIDVDNYDYITIENDKLLWHFSKNRTKDDDDRYCRFWSMFFDIKKLWLTTILSCFNFGILNIDLVEEDNNEIVNEIRLEKA